MPRPSVILLRCLLVLFALAVAACLSVEQMPAFLIICAAFATVCIGDALLSIISRDSLVCTRRLPGRFAIGQSDAVSLDLRNRSGRKLDLLVADGIPDCAEAGELPYRCSIPPGEALEVRYEVTLYERGRSTFTPTHFKISSRLRLWEFRRAIGSDETVRVYPNYEPLISYALLATSQRIEQMGIVRKNRAGMSREFHQMRDYQLGDPLSRIDWKHSARRRQLISREYQEQRDQTIILAVDGGRRMRTIDGGVPQFDHCLNSMLLLSYIALRQGDSVGVMKFGGRDRFLSPVKGPHQMPVLLNHLYDYDTAPEPSDFREASRQILTRQKKRALVIVLTNLRGEDSSDLTASLAQLRKNHVVVLANLREASIDAMAQPEEIETLDAAVAAGAAHLYQEERAEVLAQLRQLGIHTLDEPAQSLPIALCNSYLDLKAAL